MKRFCIFLLCILSSFLYAFDAEMFAGNQTMHDALIAHIKTVQAPVIIGNYILFTAAGQARHTGIAFDFENYRRIHSFSRLIRKEPGEEKKDTGILFYVLKIPEKIQLVKYRLVIDGLWTTDPVNPESEFSADANLHVSKVFIDKPLEIRSEIINEKSVRFIYEGESGQHIRLGGSFTNWDSFIYELQEIRPGFYQLELSLPQGEYYYAYYKGMDAFTDATNPDKVYTSDGRIASVIRVR